jgi:hypothetical protein
LLRTGLAVTTVVALLVGCSDSTSPDKSEGLVRWRRYGPRNTHHGWVALVGGAWGWVPGSGWPWGAVPNVEAKLSASRVL